MTGIDEAILCINEAKNAAIAIATARLFNEVNVQKSESKRIGYFVPVPNLIILIYFLQLMFKMMDMETVTIKIKNKSKLSHFLKLMEDLDYVEILQNDSSGAKDDFFDLAGMWENRDLSSKDLREKAWPKTK